MPAAHFVSPSLCLSVSSSICVHLRFHHLLDTVHRQGNDLRSDEQEFSMGEATSGSAVFSVVILTAAPPGQATEAGGAFVKVDGRESLLRSVELFLNRDNVKQIQIVFLQDALEEAKRKFGGHLGFTGVKVLGGGP